MKMINDLFSDDETELIHFHRWKLILEILNYADFLRIKLNFYHLCTFI